MANTGVLPFVRGIDFTNNDFSVSVEHKFIFIKVHNENNSYCTFQSCTKCIYKLFIISQVSNILTFLFSGREISKCCSVNERCTMVEIG